MTSTTLGCTKIAAITVCIGALSFPVHAEDSEAELAKKLSNPIATLISVPIKVDWDTNIGPADADYGLGWTSVATLQFLFPK